MATVDGDTFCSPVLLSQVSFKPASESTAAEDARRAFTLCRETEQVLCERGADRDNKRKSTSKLYSRLVFVRLLGLMLRYAPSLGPLAESYLTRSILDCKKDAHANAAFEHDLVSVGRRYIGFILRTFYRIKGFTSCESPNNPDPDDEVYRSAGEPPRRTSVEHDVLFSLSDVLPMLKGLKVLSRDGHSCMLSGYADLDYLAAHPELIEKDTIVATSVDSVRIFPASVGRNVGKLECAVADWAVLESFGHGWIQDALTEKNSDWMENMLTLNGSLHIWFGSMDLWLVPVPGHDNRHRVESKYKLAALDMRKVVKQEITFEQHDKDQEWPMPHSELLRLHAACCKVAHLSGTSRLFDQVAHDIEYEDSGQPFALLAVASSRLELYRDCAFTRAP